MTFDFERGLYIPSFFNMKVNTIYDFNTLAGLPPEVLSTYFHEYFHFLQDLTTPFGLNSAWNTYDRVLRLIIYAQSKKERVELPLKNLTDVEILFDHHKLLLAILLEKEPQLNTAFPLEELRLDSISLEVRAEAEKIMPIGLIKFVKLILKAGDEEVHYWFGALAIIETMTYLIQSKFFNTSTTPEFPYKAARLLANHVSDKFRDNDELTFALCDVALLSPYPGWTFYEILTRIDQLNFDLQRAEDVYEFGLGFIEKKWGLRNAFEKYKNSLINTVSKLYGHEAFSSSKEWLIYIIEQGYHIRLTDPTFMLQLYRSDVPFGPELIDIFKKLGAPEVINLDNKRWFAPPEDLTSKQDSIHTVFLLVFLQLHDLLLYGKTNCIMLDHCMGFEQKMPVDSDCNSSPWLKVKQDPLCPFAALWKYFGLEQREIFITR